MLMIIKMFTNIEKREKFDLELRNGVEYIKVKRGRCLRQSCKCFFRKVCKDINYNCS